MSSEVGRLVRHREIENSSINFNYSYLAAEQVHVPSMSEILIFFLLLRGRYLNVYLYLKKVLYIQLGAKEMSV